MTKCIFYRSGALTRAQETFVESNSAEVRDVFTPIDGEEDYQHVFSKPEVPGYGECETNKVLFSSIKSSNKKEETPKIDKVARKKRTKKVAKD